MRWMAGEQVHSRVSGRVAPVAARAGVERPNEHEVGGEGQRALGPGDGHDLVFHAHETWAGVCAGLQLAPSSTP